MRGASTTDDLTVLYRDLRGESSLYLETFSAKNSIVAVVKRISAKKTSALPDVFDDIDASLNPSDSGGLKFLGEFEIARRRAGIAARYESFEDAAAIVNLVRHNGRHIEDCAKLSARLRRSLDAIDAGLPSAVVRIKFLYLLARDEGYPVREDFFEKLSDIEKKLFVLIVKTPSAELSDFKAHSRGMLEKLERWTAEFTDIEM